MIESILSLWSTFSLLDTLYSINWVNAGLYVLIWAGVSASLFLGTFMMYVALMKMREVQNEIFQNSLWVRWTCFGILFVGLIFDTLLNWVLLTVAFFEFPHEFLSTARVIRHKYDSDGWRNTQALWWCKHWLTPFDSRHCIR